MPSDSSIYGLIRQPQIAPFVPPEERDLRRMRLQQLMGEREMQGLQMQDARDARERGMRLQDLYSTNPNPTPDDVGRVDFRAAEALRKARGEEAARGATTAKTTTEALQNALGIHRKQLDNVNDPQTAAQWVMGGFNDPLLSPILQRYGSPQELIARIPQTPNEFQEWRNRNAIGIEKFMADQRAKATQAETGRHNLASEKTAAGNLAVAQGNLGVSRERLTFDKSKADADKFGQPFEGTGPDGKPGMFKQNKTTGEVIPAIGVGPKVGETAQKQQTGVQNTRAALAEYKDALGKWSAIDIANPNARAKMGTVYNNALLQAKEAYNLGVLNGPDYMILQEVLTNPASMKGGITSKEALGAQVAKLDEIMGKIGQQITATQTGTPTPTAAPKTEETKIVGGKTYVKVNGQWFLSN